MHKPLRSLVNSAVLGVLASASVHAGGFSLYTEGSAVGIGNYAAGIAAEAADASIGWYNPAGLTLIRDQQAVVGGIGVFPTSEISGTSTFSTVGVPSYSESFRDMDGATDAFVPFFHYAKPLGENATFGLSLVSPFGLSTDWGNNSPVRYSATFTEVLTVNLSPQIGAKVTEHFALGAGVDLQYSRVKFNRVLGAPATMVAAGMPANLFDSWSYNKGQSFGVGFHTGVLGMFNDNHTRIGLNYQSKVKHKFHGYSRLTGILADPNLVNANTIYKNNNLFSNQVEFPDILTLSGYQDVNNKLAFLGSVVYTGWNSLDTIELNNVAAALPAGGNAAVRSVSTLNYSAAWRFALGANYHINEKWMIRSGVGYDETPTNDVDRDARLPDADRLALSVGAHYDVNPEIGVDIGYTYLHSVESSQINKTEAIGATSSFNVTASGKPRAHLIGVQAVWQVDKVMQPVLTK